MSFPVPRHPPGSHRGRARPPRALQLPPLAPGRPEESLFQFSIDSEAALLLRAGLPRGTLQQVSALALHWGVSLRETAFSLGLVQPAAYLDALGRATGLAVAAEDRPLALRSDSHHLPARHLASPLFLSLAPPGMGAAINGEALSPEAAARMALTLGPASNGLLLASRRTLERSMANGFGPAIAEDAAGSLNRTQPRLSASWGMCRWQLVVLTALAGLFLGGAVFAPREALVVFSGALSLMFFITIALRLAAAAHCWYRLKLRRKAPLLRLRDDQLPRYTVLVAMYKEARVLPQLVAALKALDYPAAKLDIKLVLETVDHETIAAARRIPMPLHFSIIAVPDGAPRTKPRALNYALRFATGDLLVIYDAEDRPDPDQLRKAASSFHIAPPQVVCLQARLTYDNAAENWLSKQFAIEYASLFAGILPMLDAARLPIPLGGTSNHFRVPVLRRIGGWDAHNVTEDADLGMRLYRAGFRAQVLDSVTYEEAACQPGNWLRQRTRWLKGWVQTYGVHMRQPFRLWRELGPAGFLAFQGHFAGIIIAALVHPLSYLILLHDAAAGLIFAHPETMIGRHIWAIALFNLVVGYTASMALGYFVLRGRQLRALTPQLVFMPIYWLFVSAAAYRAVYQLIKAPHYWEKTEHGLTKMRGKTGA